MSKSGPNTGPPPKCLLDGSDMRNAISVERDWRRPMVSQPWSIWWSDSAQFGQIHPRPAPEDIAAFYDFDAYYTHAENIDHDHQAETRQVGILSRILFSLAFRFEHGAEPTPSWWRSIIPEAARQGLEIGCGDGGQMAMFGQFLEHVRGVEPDQRALSIAQDRGLDVVAGTAENLPDAIKDRDYDLIVFSHVLEHTRDPVQSLRNTAALLSDTGVMMIEVPNNACMAAQMMGSAWRWLDPPRHLNFFTPTSLKHCAGTAGLKVEAVQYRGYVRQFAPDWILDEAHISALLQGRSRTQADIRAQVWHSAKLLARTALARPERKYDSVQLLCTRA